MSFFNRFFNRDDEEEKNKNVVQNFFSGAANKSQDFLNFAQDTSQDIASNTGSFFSNIAQGSKNVGSGGRNFLDDIAQGSQQAGSNTRNYLEDVGELSQVRGGQARSFMGDVADTTQSYGTDVRQNYNDAADSVTDFLAPAASKFGETIGDRVSGGSRVKEHESLLQELESVREFYTNVPEKREQALSDMERIQKRIDEIYQKQEDVADVSNQQIFAEAYNTAYEIIATATLASAGGGALKGAFKSSLAAMKRPAKEKATRVAAEMMKPAVEKSIRGTLMPILKRAAKTFFVAPKAGDLVQPATEPIVESDLGQQITKWASGNNIGERSVLGTASVLRGEEFEQTKEAYNKKLSDPETGFWTRVFMQAPISTVDNLVAIFTGFAVQGITQNPGLATKATMGVYGSQSIEGQRRQNEMNEDPDADINMGNVFTDVAMDSLIGNVVGDILGIGWGSFKKSIGKNTVKDATSKGIKILQDTLRGGVTEGITEPTQTMIKLHNDFIKAKNDEERKDVVDQTKFYLLEGGVLEEAAISFVTGGVLGGVSSQVESMSDGPVNLQNVVNGFKNDIVDAFENPKFQKGFIGFDGENQNQSSLGDIVTPNQRANFDMITELISEPVNDSQAAEAQQTLQAMLQGAQKNFEDSGDKFLNTTHFDDSSQVRGLIDIIQGAKENPQGDVLQAQNEQVESEVTDQTVETQAQENYNKVLEENTIQNIIQKPSDPNPVDALIKSPDSNVDTESQTLQASQIGAFEISQPLPRLDGNVDPQYKGYMDTLKADLDNGVRPDQFKGIKKADLDNAVTAIEAGVLPKRQSELTAYKAIALDAQEHSQNVSSVALPDMKVYQKSDGTENVITFDVTDKGVVATKRDGTGKTESRALKSLFAQYETKNIDKAIRSFVESQYQPLQGKYEPTATEIKVAKGETLNYEPTAEKGNEIVDLITGNKKQSRSEVEKTRLPKRPSPKGIFSKMRTVMGRITSELQNVGYGAQVTIENMDQYVLDQYKHITDLSMDHFEKTGQDVFLKTITAEGIEVKTKLTEAEKMALMVKQELGLKKSMDDHVGIVDEAHNNSLTNGITQAFNNTVQKRITDPIMKLIQEHPTVRALDNFNTLIELRLAQSRATRFEKTGQKNVPMRMPDGEMITLQKANQMIEDFKASLPDIEYYDTLFETTNVVNQLSSEALDMLVTAGEISSQDAKRMREANAFYVQRDVLKEGTKNQTIRDAKTAARKGLFLGSYSSGTFGETTLSPLTSLQIYHNTAAKIASTNKKTQTVFEYIKSRFPEQALKDFNFRFISDEKRTTQRIETARKIKDARDKLNSIVSTIKQNNKLYKSAEKGLSTMEGRLESMRQEFLDTYSMLTQSESEIDLVGQMMDARIDPDADVETSFSIKRKSNIDTIKRSIVRNRKLDVGKVLSNLKNVQKTDVSKSAKPKDVTGYTVQTEQIEKNKQLFVKKVKEMMDMIQNENISESDLILDMMMNEEVPTLFWSFYDQVRKEGKDIFSGKRTSEQYKRMVDITAEVDSLKMNLVSEQDISNELTRLYKETKKDLTDFKEQIEQLRDPELSTAENARTITYKKDGIPITVEMDSDFYSMIGEVPPAMYGALHDVLQNYGKQLLVQGAVATNPRSLIVQSLSDFLTLAMTNQYTNLPFGIDAVINPKAIHAVVAKSLFNHETELFMDYISSGVASTPWFSPNQIKQIERDALLIQDNMSIKKSLNEARKAMGKLDVKKVASETGNVANIIQKNTVEAFNNPKEAFQHAIKNTFYNTIAFAQLPSNLLFQYTKLSGYTFTREASKKAQKSTKKDSDIIMEMLVQGSVNEQGAQGLSEIAMTEYMSRMKTIRNEMLRYAGMPDTSIQGKLKRGNIDPNAGIGTKLGYGASSAFLNFFQVFYNVAVQATASQVTRMSFQTGKKAAVKAWVNSLPIMALALYAAQTTFSDEETEEDYDRIPEWERRRNIIIYPHMLPFLDIEKEYVVDPDTGDTHLKSWKIPSIEQQAIVSNTTTSMARALMKQDPESVQEGITKLMMDFVPLSFNGESIEDIVRSSTVAGNPFTATAFGLVTNQDAFWGNDINPEYVREGGISQRSEDLIEDGRGDLVQRQSTPDIYKSGGVLGMTPEQTKYAARSLSGGFIDRLVSGDMKPGNVLKDVFTRGEGARTTTSPTLQAEEDSVRGLKGEEAVEKILIGKEIQKDVKSILELPVGSQERIQLMIPLVMNEEGEVDEYALEKLQDAIVTEAAVKALKIKDMDEKINWIQTYVSEEDHNTFMVETARLTNRDATPRNLANSSVQVRSNYVYEKLLEIDDIEAQIQYLESLDSQGILTKSVEEEVARLLKTRR